MASKTCMTSRDLKFNMSKTKFIVFFPNQVILSHPFSHRRQIPRNYSHNKLCPCLPNLNMKFCVSKTYIFYAFNHMSSSNYTSLIIITLVSGFPTAGQFKIN